MQLSVHSYDLPENTTIDLEGQDCLSPSFVEVVAQKPIQRVKLRWMTPQQNRADLLLELCV